MGEKTKSKEKEKTWKSFLSICEHAGYPGSEDSRDFKTAGNYIEKFVTLVVC